MFVCIWSEELLHYLRESESFGEMLEVLKSEEEMEREEKN